MTDIKTIQQQIEDVKKHHKTTNFQ